MYTHKLPTLEHMQHVTQHNKSKQIASLNWLGIKETSQPCSHDITWAIILSELNAKRQNDHKFGVNHLISNKSHVVS